MKWKEVFSRGKVQLTEGAEVVRRRVKQHTTEAVNERLRMKEVLRENEGLGTKEEIGEEEGSDMKDILKPMIICSR